MSKTNNDFFLMKTVWCKTSIAAVSREPKILINTNGNMIRCRKYHTTKNTLTYTHLS